MHRLFTVTTVIVSTLLISLSADAGGPHVRVFDGNSGTTAADDGHKDWINLNRVTSIQWAPGVESRNVKVRGRLPAPAKRSGGLPTGKRQHRPLTVIKPIDKATPLLARAAKTGTPLARVILIVPATQGPAAGKPVPYYRYKLTNVRVTSHQTGGSSGDSVPMEQISLNYEK